MKDRNVELIAGFVDGILSDTEREELLSAAREDTAVAEELVREVSIHRRLRFMSRESGETDEQAVREILHYLRVGGESREFMSDLKARWARELRKRRLWRRAGFAAAAAIVAAVSVWWAAGQRPGGAVVAVVREVTGQSGLKGAPKVGDEVCEGDRIESGEKGAVILAYAVGARVELGADSVLNAPTARSASRLERGALAASVAKSPASDVSPFVMETPHARVTVVGTRFSLAIDGGGGSSALGSTWLQVDEGTVEFTRLADGRSIAVAAGQFAVAGGKASDYALKAYADGTTWVDGPVVFRDGFEEGMDNWQVVSRSSEKGRTYAPASNADEKRVQIGGDEKVKNALSIDVPRNRKIDIGIRLRNAALPEAYMAEWTTIHNTVGTVVSPVLPGVTEYRNLYTAPGAYSIRVGSAHRMRFECVPAPERDAEDGWHQVSTYRSDGKPNTRILVRLTENTFIIEVRNGRILIDDVVVRKLLPSRKIRDDV